jgi:RHH-type transcriptional regulator, proline utilization regulon repressor / proline dehydrogenase / delta 1-pyrroline-5-carboxylate dehydrogenase
MPYNSRMTMQPAASQTHTSEIGRAINPLYLADEEPLVRQHIDRARLASADQRSISQRALALVQTVRQTAGTGGALDAFLREYSLASREGVILMCLAEALLRIPDGETADRLIADKIPSGAWGEHLGDSESLFVNASTWGLLLTGRVVSLDRDEVGEPRSWFARLTARLGEPVVRAALKQVMRINSSWVARSTKRCAAQRVKTNAPIDIRSTCSARRR